MNKTHKTRIFHTLYDYIYTKFSLISDYLKEEQWKKEKNIRVPQLGKDLEKLNNELYVTPEHPNSTRKRMIPINQQIPITKKIEEITKEKRKVERSMPASTFTALPTHPIKQIKGGLLLPFGYMKKDALKTFTGYKSLYHVIYDALQSFRGMINIIEGITHFTVGTFYFMFNLVSYPISVTSTLPIFNRITTLREVNGYYQHSFSRSLSWMLYGLSNMGRGMTQIGMMPLLGIKIPIRIGITIIEGLTSTINKPKRNQIKKEVETQKSSPNKTQSTYGILEWMLGGFKKRIIQENDTDTNLNLDYLKPKKTRKDEKAWNNESSAHLNTPGPR